MKIVIAAIMAALISGIGVGFQGTFNALLQRNIGLVGLICWVHFVGFVVSIPLVIIYRPNLIRQIMEFKQAGVPFFVLFSGVFGLIIVPGIAFSIEKLNPAIALAILMLGQLLISMFIQQFGLLGVTQENISMMQVFAILLIILGVGLFFIR